MRRLLVALLALASSVAFAGGRLPQLGFPVSYGGASITLVQTATPVYTATSGTPTITINSVASGDFLVLLVDGGGNTPTLSTPTDTNGTLQTAIAYNAANPGMGIYYEPSAASGTHTFNLTFSSSLNTVLYVAEFSSAVTGFDKASAIASGSSVSPLSASITPAANGELLIGLINAASTPTISSWGSPLVEQQSDASGPSSAWAWAVQPTAGSVSASATLSVSEPWVAAIAAFN